MIRELKTLIAVAHDGTFLAAGNRLGLTQAAVSAQMKRLEDELGSPLFDRNGRTARLNERGMQVLLQAQELIRLYQQLGRDTPQMQAPTRLDIGAIASAQRALLPSVLAAFHRQWPECRTRVSPGLSMELLNLVDVGEIDMAIVIRPPFALDDHLRWTSLAHEPFRLIVPSSLPRSDWHQALRTQPFIRYNRASFGGRLVERFLQDRHLIVNEVCEVDELDAIVNLVALGLGVALVPQVAAWRRWPRRVRAIDLESHTFHRDIGLVHRTPRTLSEPARAFIEVIGSGL